MIPNCISHQFGRTRQAAGKLPALDEVLDAVAEARQKFAVKILKARNGR
jgi:hypothetical protein